MYKVKDLIEDLKKCDPELPVLTLDMEWGYFYAGKPKIKDNIEIQYHFSEKEALYIAKGVVI